MPPWPQILLAIAVGPLLWLAGAVFFDAVHFVLHRMLRSPFRVLRTLAWPHQVHHEWIDTELRVRFENQGRNLYCHVIPEYLTQLVFTGALALVLPLPFVAVLLLLQTAVFLGILAARGLDRNHRPIDVLDAYRPGFHTPPAYHALHHVHPDAYYSAYTKVVDFLVGGGAKLRGRGFAFAGTKNAFGRSLREALGRAGAIDLGPVEALDARGLARLDVLVLAEPGGAHAPAVEDFLRAAGRRKLPPEVWAAYERAGDPLARHYHLDVRVNHRAIVVGHGAGGREARIALRRIRRGGCFVPTRRGPGALLDLVRFVRARGERPCGAPAVGHRRELPEPAAC